MVLHYPVRITRTELDQKLTLFIRSKINIIYLTKNKHYLLFLLHLARTTHKSLLYLCSCVFARSNTCIGEGRGGKGIDGLRDGLIIPYSA